MCSKAAHCCLSPKFREVYQHFTCVRDILNITQIQTTSYDSTPHHLWLADEGKQEHRTTIGHSQQPLPIVHKKTLQSRSDCQAGSHLAAYMQSTAGQEGYICWEEGWCKLLDEMNHFSSCSTWDSNIIRLVLIEFFMSPTIHPACHMQVIWYPIIIEYWNPNPAHSLSFPCWCALLGSTLLPQPKMQRSSSVPQLCKRHHPYHAGSTYIIWLHSPPPATGRPRGTGV